MTVIVVTERTNSPWPEDITVKVVKVFKGTRMKAACAWAVKQEEACDRSEIYDVERWKVTG